MSFTELHALITIAMALLGIGIGVGKVLADVTFLKKETRKLAVLEREQIEMKLILRQIAKKLKISY